MSNEFEKHIYNKIMSQTGFHDFQLLINKWERLSKNIERKIPNVPIILPDLFLVSQSGTGRTLFLSLLSEYLMGKPNLMDFYGDIKYFEFMLNYCAPNEYFSEIQRFMAEIESAAGFRSEYRGIVFIDIDEWIEHFEEKHFACFMEYFSDNSDDWLVVFSVSYGKQEQICQMEAFIAAYVRLEHLMIDVPTVSELSEYAGKLLELYGFALNMQAKELLSESIGVLSDNKYFDGYKIVKILAEDIAYFLYTQDFEKYQRKRDHRKDIIISASNISKFSKDGEYIQGMIFKIEKIRRIGF